ncbi:hypothetical protein [Natrinema amylolyticum]|uniref:hypothetical protein n=1 Tax=Natrinema amylolyticum TaxID=2878679 RepID=UPI001CFA9DAA|nr:hypothetical protein [Natrinema amylolyticum]
MFGDRTPAATPRDEPESDRRGRAVPLALVALAIGLVAVVLGRRRREPTLEPPF